MIFYWAGDGGSDPTAWTDGLNWRDASGNQYATSVYPGSDSNRLDDAVFDRAAGAAVAGTTLTNKLNSIRVTVGYKKSDGSAIDIGSSSSYLQCSASEVVIESAGNVYLRGSSGDGLARVIVNNTASGKSAFLAGTIGTLIAEGGSIDIGSGASLSGLETNQTISSPVIVIQSGVTLPSAISIRGGSITCESAVTTLNLYSGTWVQSSGDVGMLNLQSGTFDWRARGSLGTLDAYGGTFTAANSSAVRRINQIVARQNASINLDNGLGNVRVIGNIEYRGGVVNLPSRSQYKEALSEVFSGTNNATLGINPQSVTSSSVWGSGRVLSFWDALTVYCSVGNTSGSVTFQLYKYSSLSYDNEEAITSPAPLTFSATDDDKTKAFTIYGWQLGNKPVVRVKCTVTGGTALVSALYIHGIGRA